MEAKPIGELMKEAAREKRLSVKEIAARMGVTRGAVYKWFTGRTKPWAENIIAYAEALGEPVERFSNGGTPVQDELIAAQLLAIADLVMAGKSAPAALARVTGRDDLLSEEERLRLSSASAAVREGLTLQAGRDWDLLSEAEKREVLQRVAELAARQRPR